MNGMDAVDTVDGKRGSGVTVVTVVIDHPRNRSSNHEWTRIHTNNCAVALQRLSPVGRYLQGAIPTSYSCSLVSIRGSTAVCRFIGSMPFFALFAVLCEIPHLPERQ